MTSGSQVSAVKCHPRHSKMSPGISTALSRGQPGHMGEGVHLSLTSRWDPERRAAARRLLCRAGPR